MQAKFYYEDQTLHCSGAWVLNALQAVSDIADLPKNLSKQVEVVIDARQVEQLDTAGAYLLQKIKQQLLDAGHRVSLHTGNDQLQLLMRTVAQVKVEQALQKEKTLKAQQSAQAEDPLQWLGRYTLSGMAQSFKFLEFIGELVILAGVRAHYKIPLRLRAIIQSIYKTGYSALPIVGLLSFLIGIVLTYQMGIQLSKYGANIYIVDLLGLSVLREFAPLLTAIIVAGRTSSAFTAEISTMKINEELDALRTMGVSPSDVIVLPKVIGLLISLPLLCVWADIWGVCGGMLMSRWYLNVTNADFLQHFQQYIPVRSFLVGLSKTPVFAVIIACIGCFQGLRVQGGAANVGWQTTKSVVQAIFLIIIADAAFSILYSWLRI